MAAGDGAGVSGDCAWWRRSRPITVDLARPSSTIIGLIVYLEIYREPMTVCFGRPRSAPSVSTSCVISPFGSPAAAGAAEVILSRRDLYTVSCSNPLVP